jgi:hypothetical protein
MQCVGKHVKKHKFLDEDMDPWQPTWDLCEQNCHCDKSFDRSLSMFAANVPTDPKASSAEMCENMVIVNLSSSSLIKDKLKKCGLIKQ